MEYSRANKLEMNPDKFIEELLNKKYDRSYISDILKIQELNNSILNLSQSNARQRNAVDGYLDSRETSFQNLAQASDTKRKTQSTNLRFSYLKSRSTQPHKGMSYKTEHRPGFSYNTAYKRTEAVKVQDGTTDGENFQEISKPYLIKRTSVETTFSIDSLITLHFKDTKANEVKSRLAMDFLPNSNFNVLLKCYNEFILTTTKRMDGKTYEYLHFLTT